MIIRALHPVFFYFLLAVPHGLLLLVSNADTFCIWPLSVGPPLHELVSSRYPSPIHENKHAATSTCTNFPLELYQSPMALQSKLQLAFEFLGPPLLELLSSRYPSPYHGSVIDVASLALAPYTRMALEWHCDCRWPELFPERRFPGQWRNIETDLPGSQEPGDTFG